MELEKKLKIIKYIQAFIVVMAIIYIVMYFMEWKMPAIFMKLDNVFGFLPSLFNKTGLKADFGYRKIPIGYLLAAISHVIMFLCINKFTSNIQQDEEYIDEDQRNNMAYIAKAKQKVEQDRETLKQTKYKEMFYGLFELDVQFIDSFNKNPDDLLKLRLEYYKILVNKLQTKYDKQIEFYVKDKIFFLSDNYNLMHSVTIDILKILDLLIQVSKENQITMKTLFSYWIDAKTANKTSVFKILSQINAFKNTNKIIITNEVYLKIIALEYEPWCNVNSLGTFKLFKVHNNQDIVIELLELTGLK